MTSHDQVRIAGHAEVVTEQRRARGDLERQSTLLQTIPRFDRQSRTDRLSGGARKRVRYMREWALEYYDVPVNS